MLKSINSVAYICISLSVKEFSSFCESVENAFSLLSKSALSYHAAIVGYYSPKTHVGCFLFQLFQSHAAKINSRTKSTSSSDNTSCWLSLSCEMEKAVLFCRLEMLKGNVTCEYVRQNQRSDCCS